MTNKSIKVLPILISFFLTGFCLVWISAGFFYIKTLDDMSRNVISENSISYVLQDKSIDFEKTAYEECVVYSSCEEMPSIRGVYVGNKANTTVPMISGEFLSHEDCIKNMRYAVVGKGVAENASIRNQKHFIVIGDDEYEIKGVMGLSSTASTLDYSILISLGNATELLSKRVIYTFDGSKKVVQEATSEFEKDYPDSLLTRDNTVSLSILYKNTNAHDGKFVFLCFAVATLLMLASFAFFNVYNNRYDLKVFSLNGADYLQLVSLFFRKHIISVLVSYACGVGVAVIGMIAFQVDMLSLFSLIIAFFAGTTTIFVVAGISIFAFAKKLSFCDGIVVISKPSRILKGALLVSITIICIYLNIVISNSSFVSSGHERLEKMESQQYYALTSDITNEEFENYYRDADYLKRLKSAVNAFLTKEQYGYYIATNQPIYTRSILYHPEFYYCIEEDAIGLNALQVSNHFFDVFKLSPEIGESFSDEDYLGDKKLEIPVILGADYTEFYSVGDEINDIEYLFKNYTLRIIGILPKGSYYNLQGSLQLLDRTIIMPSFIFINEPIPDTNDYLHQFALYGQKYSGVFSPQNDIAFGEVANFVQDVAQKYGTYSQDFLTIPKSSSYFLVCMSENYALISSLTVVMLVVLLAIMLFCITEYIFKENIYKYRIMLKCGAGFAQLLAKMLTEILPITLIASVVALHVCESWAGVSFIHLILVGAIVFPCIITCFYLNKAIKTI